MQNSGYASGIHLRFKSVAFTSQNSFASVPDGAYCAWKGGIQK